MFFLYILQPFKNISDAKQIFILRWAAKIGVTLRWVELCISLVIRQSLFSSKTIPNIYHIFPARRRGFRPSRMTSNNLISPMKFCYNTNSTLPKQCQSSRSVLQDGSRTFGLFWKEKKNRLITEEIRYMKIYLIKLI